VAIFQIQGTKQVHYFDNFTRRTHFVYQVNCGCHLWHSK